MKCIIFFSLLMHLDYLNAQVPHRINIGQNSDKKQNISLNSIASSISYVPLETTKECLLENDILRLEFFEDHLYLCDGRFIYVFTKNGKFQKKIGKQGKGPGEYGKVITDFLLDKQAKTITVFDIMKKSFIVYDIVGTFIREYKSDFISGPMASLNDKSFISYNTGFIYDKSVAWYDLFSMTKAGKTGKGYTFNKQKKQRYGLNIYPAIFYYHQNKLLYKNPYEEIVFMIENQKKIPIYVFDLGRYQQSKDEADIKVKVDKNKNVSIISNPTAKEKLSVYRLCESESYLFVEYHINNEKRLGAFDKKQKQFYRISDGKIDGLTENMENGLPFWPKLGVQDNVMIDYYHADELINELKSANVGSQLSNVLNKLDEEDNQVLIFATLKN